MDTILNGTTHQLMVYSGSRRSSACAGANTLRNQSWRVFETRRHKQNPLIPGVRTVVSRRLITTRSRCRWKTQAKDLRLPESEVFAFVESLRFRREKSQLQNGRCGWHKNVSSDPGRSIKNGNPASAAICCWLVRGFSSFDFRLLPA